MAPGGRGGPPLDRQRPSIIAHAGTAERFVPQLRREGLAITDSADISMTQDLLSKVADYESKFDKILSPRRRTDARNTLSDLHGFGAFPWHTDGAVAVTPPRYIALLGHCVDVHASPTELVDLTAASQVDGLLKARLLRVRLASGQIRRLRCSEMRGGVRLRRWDPRHYFGDRQDMATTILTLEELQPTHSIEWLTGRLAILDNWRFLHRRPEVNPQVNRAIWRGYGY